MFGLIRKKSIKNKLQREYDKGCAITKREMTKKIKELNIKLREEKEKRQKDNYNHNNDKRKMKREYLVYKDNKYTLLKGINLIEYLDSNYMIMSPKQTQHCITRISSLLTDLNLSSEKEEKKIVSLMDRKVG